MNVGGSDRRGPRSRRISDRSVALIGIAVFALIAALIFGSLNPFASHFELNAQVRNATQVRPDNPVRIAGITVGKVTGVSAGPDDTSIVEMELDHDALPIRADATAALKPRLALEGNLYVDLSPGSPLAPELEEGATIPVSQTSGAVQLDQALDVFEKPVREGLTSSLKAFAFALGPESGAPSGAHNLKHAVRELDSSLVAITRVSESARGRRPGDLAAATSSSADVTGQLSRAPAALTDISANISSVGAALTDSEGSLAASIRRLSPVLRDAPGTLARLDVALPKLRRFAVDLRPALAAAAPALPPLARLVEQVDLASRPNELPPLVAELGPLARRLPRLQSLAQGMLPFVDQIGTCLRDNVIPTLNMQVPDPLHATGRPVYQDLVHAFANLSAANPSFDANGRILRVNVAAGEKTLTAAVPPFGKLVAGAAPDIAGVAPIWLGPGTSLDWQPGVDCRSQRLPDLTQRQQTGPLATETPVDAPPRPALTPALTPQRLEAALAKLKRANRRGGK